MALHHQSHLNSGHHSLFAPTPMNVAFPSLARPIITTVDHSAISMSSSSGHNNQQQQQQQQSQSSSTPEHELTKLQAQNQTLSKKLQLKTADYDKLTRKVEKLENELAQFKDLLTQINMNLEHGQALNSDAIKFAIQTAVNSMKNGSSSSTSSTTGKQKPYKYQPKRQSGCSRCYCETERPFRCDYPDCGKRFRQKHHLDYHRAIHAENRMRFVCEWQGCAKSFVSKYNLQEHTKLHNGQQNRCLYPGCGMSFSSKYGLNRHQATQHQIITNQ